MEINTQQVEALLHMQEQQAQLPRKSSAKPDGFDALLTQKIGDELDKTSIFADPALKGTSLYNPIILNEVNTATDDPDLAIFEAAFAQASGTLDLWDDYAKALGSAANGSSLRNVYSLLEGIDNQVAQLRTNPLAGKNAAFDDILNELEVLSATEKFKFNRGDYLI